MNGNSEIMIFGDDLVQEPALITPVHHDTSKGIFLTHCQFTISDERRIFCICTLEDFYDYRLEKTGMTFDQLVEKTDIYFAPPKFRQYEQKGFATPSGKVELKSSILEDLGFDPLPYFREDPPADSEYPLKLFTGVREDGFFQTGHRHIPEMRKRHPAPLVFVSPGTAEQFQLEEDEWVEVENELGKISIKVAIKEAMPDGLIRIPHGWWKPEMKQGAGHLSGALKYADAQLCRDDEDYLDREQGMRMVMRSYWMAAAWLDI